MASIVVERLATFDEFRVMSAGVVQVRNQDHVADSAGHKCHREEHGDAEQDALKTI
jgi:hypothetical protein